MVLDNRGTGLNYPVQCDDYSLWNQDNFKLFPKSEDEWNTTVEAAARAGQSCVEKTGPVIHFIVSTLENRDCCRTISFLIEFRMH